MNLAPASVAAGLVVLLAAVGRAAARESRHALARQGPAAQLLPPASGSGTGRRPGGGRLAHRAAMLARRLAESWVGERRRRGRQADLVALLDEVASSLRAGASVSQSLGAAAARPGPARSEVEAVLAEVAAGSPLVGALEGWADRAGDAGTRLTASALALAVTTGGPPAAAVDAVAASLRARAAAVAEARAHAAQARASATVLTVLPVAFTALTAAADPRVGRFLLASPAGWACLLAGGSLAAGGGLWMRRIVRSVS